MFNVLDNLKELDTPKSKSHVENALDTGTQLKIRHPCFLTWWGRRERARKKPNHSQWNSKERCRRYGEKIRIKYNDIYLYHRKTSILLLPNQITTYTFKHTHFNSITKLQEIHRRVISNLVTKFQQTLWEIINVTFHTAKVGIKEIRNHQNSVSSLITHHKGLSNTCQWATIVIQSNKLPSYTRNAIGFTQTS